VIVTERFEGYQPNQVATWNFWESVPATTGLGPDGILDNADAIGVYDRSIHNHHPEDSPAFTTLQHFLASTKRVVVPPTPFNTGHFIDVRTYENKMYTNTVIRTPQ
jgi:hypothetical protein